MKKWIFWGWGFFWFLTAIFQGCGSSAVPESVQETETISYTLQIPEDIGDGWIVDSLQNVGLKSQPFVDLMNDLLNNGNRNIHGMVVVKDHRLVFEAYFPGNEFQGGWIPFDNRTRHNTHSATKSVTASLLGIAIDRGILDGLSEKVYDFFPDYSATITPTQERIKLENLLNMRAGWEWLEWGVPVTSPESDMNKMYWADDPIGYVLEKPVITEPGTVFCYSGGVTNVIGQIIRNASGISFSDFAHQVLLEPLGITEYRWALFPSGLEYVSGDLRITPRQMAKIGYLFINNGKWQDRQIISQNWIEESTRKRDVQLPDYVEWAEEYGFHWWFQTYRVNSQAFESFRAEGWGGQLIIQIPAMNMVVVFTGGNYTMDSNQLGEMLRDIVEETILAAAF